MENNSNKVDPDCALQYDLYILEKMIDSLPISLYTPFRRQFDALTKSLCIREENFKSIILSELGDLRLHIKTLEFDRDATKRERDELQRRLDGK
jgi:hypothetical protein